jgi:hypothetical protein
MPLRISWHRAVQVFAQGLPGKKLETTWSGFDQGGLSPCLVLWRCTCPGWLSTASGDPCSTQVLNRHYGAKSHTVSQLNSSGTTSTSKSPQLSPSG